MLTRERRIGLASYIYSLDGQTTYNYLPFATSAYDKHSLISTIQVAQSVISTSPPVHLTLRAALTFLFLCSCVR